MLCNRLLLYARVENAIVVGRTTALVVTNGVHVYAYDSIFLVFLLQLPCSLCTLARFLVDFDFLWILVTDDIKKVQQNSMFYTCS